MSSAWHTNMPRSLDYPRAGLDEVLAGAARAFPDRIAVQHGEETLTFAELHDRALRVAQGLRERGVTPGDVVAMHMPNTLWYVVAYYGAICAGAAVASANPAQPSRSLALQLEDCRASVVVTHPSCADVLAQADTPAVRLILCVPGETPPHPGTVPFADLLAAEPLTGYRVDPELVAHLQLTGGTTGRSKAVRVLHRNLVASLLQIVCFRASTVPALDEKGGVVVRQVPEAVNQHSLPLGEGASIAVAPLFHGMGLITQSVNLLLGQTTIMAPGFDPDRFLADVERHRVSAITGSPAMYYALLRSAALDKHDYSRVRMVISSAAPIDTTTLRKLAEVFPNALVCEGYGLTEATSGLAGAPLDPTVPTPVGSVGVHLFDTELEIRAEDGTTVLDAGEVGELWARGPQITDGYEGSPELTAQQFVGGWLRTGDMARLDGHGHLFLAGRAKDMIIYKGYNVYPQPLEEILCTHPAVAQAAVVAGRSESAGEIPVAFVVLRPGVEPADGLADEVMAHLAEQVAPYQKVRAVHVVDALPLTPTGKILKTDLRDRLAKAAGGSA
ncbi:class I adenylate-forming enzyme family protein [Streptomyces venezuelae]|uniref:class I adenylate-forming enzyme family protein n=1 Tax=Streptomyces venezuelae TaxID=54571 RepID=UPI0036277B13